MDVTLDTFSSEQCYYLYDGHLKEIYLSKVISVVRRFIFQYVYALWNAVWVATVKVLSLIDL